METPAGCEEGPGMFAKFMALGSLLMVIVSLPISLFFVVKVVQVRRLSIQMKLRNESNIKQIEGE